MMWCYHGNYTTSGSEELPETEMLIESLKQQQTRHFILLSDIMAEIHCNSQRH